jgi:hypothetical protein
MPWRKAMIQIETTGPTGAEPVDFEEIASIFDLTPDARFNDTINAIGKCAYGDFSPDEDDAPLRRVWGAELLGSLRSLTDSAKAFSTLAGNAFPGAAPLACADFAGSERIEELQGAVATLAATRERDRPMRANRALTKIIVGMLTVEWLRLGGARSIEEFESFARLILITRRDLPEPMFTGAILALTANWREANGAKVRSPLTYAAGDWTFVSGYTLMGGASDDYMADLPDDAKGHTEHWAQSGSALVARYEDSARAEKLVIIANSCCNAAPHEQIAFKCNADTDHWAECEIPHDISRLLAWERFEAGRDDLPDRVDSQLDI